MQIYVEGLPSDSPLAKDLTEAAMFYADLLMDPRMIRNINLDIEIEKELDVLGECINEDGTKNPRNFTIRLLSQSAHDMIRTLAHEMVHLKQHAKNELYKEDHWMGKPWKPKRKECEYYDSPWELDAFGREEGLFVRFSQFKEWN